MQLSEGEEEEALLRRWRYIKMGKGLGAWRREGRAAYRLEKSLLEPPSSWDGEPAPERELAAMMVVEFKPEERPK